EVEDEATLFARWENGATGLFVTSTGDFPGTNRLEIDGTAGKIVLEHSKLSLETFEPDERVFRYDESKKPKETKKEEFTFETKGSHAKIIENFTEHLLNGTPLIAPGRDGLNQLALSNAAYLSSFKNKEVALPPDEKEFEELLEGLRKKSAEKEAKKTTPDGKYKSRWQVNW
ncbi:MAG: gfo/Idh/MocA family oxidoreductase, partial [Clostridia bacterium]|nr:gfo/Idh/MocA family oxidoreductase [Clostridia bacterium]